MQVTDDGENLYRLFSARTARLAARRRGGRAVDSGNLLAALSLWYAFVADYLEGGGEARRAEVFRLYMRAAAEDEGRPVSTGRCKRLLLGVRTGVAGNRVDARSPNVQRFMERHLGLRAPRESRGRAWLRYAAAVRNVLVMSTHLEGMCDEERLAEL